MRACEQSGSHAAAHRLPVVRIAERGITHTSRLPGSEAASAVTLRLTTNAGASLTCTTNPTAATSGVASFAGCAIDKSGTYTLTATNGSLTPATSSTMTINPAPAATNTGPSG